MSSHPLSPSAKWHTDAAAVLKALSAAEQGPYGGGYDVGRGPGHPPRVAAAVQQLRGRAARPVAAGTL
ncbi:MAG TPA: hypothetical protein VGJ60_36100 [Chloroflexota bacterium]